MYIIPLQQLVEAIASDNDNNSHSDKIRISAELFRLLLQGCLASAPFDEASYLKANPDVAVAIRQGNVASARDHFLSAGYFEGRDGAMHPFDEAWYIKRYPDVMQAVKAGAWDSGLHHYKVRGMKEWRSPCGAAEDSVHLWRGVFSKNSALETV